MAVSMIGRALASVGRTGEVHTTQKNPIGMRVDGEDGSTFIYLAGCASTIAGSVVTFDGAGATTLIAANAKGLVAVATGITVASTWGWYCIASLAWPVDVVANSAINGSLGRETTDGKVGDGRVAGDQIATMFQNVATTAAAVVNCRFQFPFVDDFLGA